LGGEEEEEEEEEEEGSVTAVRIVIAGESHLVLKK